jgi:phage-related protein
VVKLKPIRWVGTAKAELHAFPDAVRKAVGAALTSAQLGGKHPSAKPLKGFGGAGVLEIVDDFDGDTYRAVYSVRFAGVLYVLHAFQKKSRKGIETPKSDIDLIKVRLRFAEEDHKHNPTRIGGVEK